MRSLARSPNGLQLALQHDPLGHQGDEVGHDQGAIACVATVDSPAGGQCVVAPGGYGTSGGPAEAPGGLSGDTGIGAEASEQPAMAAPVAGQPVKEGAAGNDSTPVKPHPERIARKLSFPYKP